MKENSRKWRLMWPERVKFKVITDLREKKIKQEENLKKSKANSTAKAKQTSCFTTKSDHRFRVSSKNRRKPSLPHRIQNHQESNYWI